MTQHSNTSNTATITGNAAIALAEQDSAVVLCKFADPTEDAREGLTLDEALEIAAEDPGLIYAETSNGDGAGDHIHIDDETLRAIRAESAEHGDADQVADCDRALAGDAAAMTRVAEAATDSEHSAYRVDVDPYGQAYLEEVSS